MKAIVSGLQSTAIYRLRRVWAEVDRDYYDLYLDLADIFSEENNQSQARELLMKEGTAKFADMDGKGTVKSTRGHKRNKSAGSGWGWGTTRSKKIVEEVICILRSFS